MRDEDRVHHLDGLCAGLAMGQHGVVALWQLLELGVSKSAVGRRLQSGHLHRLHRGGYAVGHPRLSQQGFRMAAVLAGGRAAALSHRAAGAEWGLRHWGGRPSITVPHWRRSTATLEIHSSSLPRDEVTTCDGITITTVPRTLLDLAAILDSHDLARAVNEAQVRRLTDRLSVPALLDRHPGRRGAAALRAVLEAEGFGMGVTRSELEELFVRFLSSRALPHPELNATIHVGDRLYSPDCLWRPQRLIVELQGARFHGTARALTLDAGRARRLLLAGWRVISVTWAQLHDRREAVALARDLRTALG